MISLQAFFAAGFPARKAFRLKLGLTLALGLALLPGIGCKSTGSGGSADEIRWNTPGQIKQVAIEVFKEKGYRVVDPNASKLVFEREGSKMNNIAYGSWIGDTPVWVRVKLSITKVGEATYRLRGDVYMVQDRGSANEEEIPTGKLTSRPHQKVVKEVVTRFRFQPLSPP